MKIKIYTHKLVLIDGTATGFALCIRASISMLTVINLSNFISISYSFLQEEEKERNRSAGSISHLSDWQRH